MYYVWCSYQIPNDYCITGQSDTIFADERHTSEAGAAGIGYAKAPRTKLQVVCSLRRFVGFSYLGPHGDEKAGAVEVPEFHRCVQGLILESCVDVVDGQPCTIR